MKPNAHTPGSRPNAQRFRSSTATPFHLAPFGEVGRALGRLVGELPAATAPLANWARELEGQGLRPQIEVIETEAGLRLHAELPGLSEEHIDLRVEDGHLILAGEKHAVALEPKATSLHNERRFGAFRRALALPFEIDLDQAQATFEDGVLTVELTRAEDDSSERRIPVKRKA